MMLHEPCKKTYGLTHEVLPLCILPQQYARLGFAQPIFAAYRERPISFNIFGMRSLNGKKPLVASGQKLSSQARRT